MSYHKTIYETIQKEHPDISYYKQDEISLILSKGLASTVRDQPRNPVEYFATWLLEYDKVQKIAANEVVEEKKVQKLKAEHSRIKDAAAKKAAEAQKV